jgi:hypothetical protein
VLLTRSLIGRAVRLDLGAAFRVLVGRGQPAVARGSDRHVGPRRGDRELLPDDPGLLLLA